MTMIDPKKIEEWKTSYERYDVAANLPDEDDAAEACRALATEWLGVAAEAVPALLSEREEMLSVLREVEWIQVGLVKRCALDCGGTKVEPEIGHTPENYPQEQWGHVPSCRLSALLRSGPA